MKILFLLLAAGILHPQVPSALALILGIGFALILKNPYPELTKKHTSTLLMASVIGLGFAVDFKLIGTVGAKGFGYTFVSIFVTVLVGLFLGRIFKVPLNSSLLICAGTAICGGSAIAALAPAISAKNEETSVSLGTVFFLNSIALLIFPLLGHWAQLGQTDFGLWAALAVHDTSSVVGTTMQYGAESLAIGTTVKLARALWIAPLTLCIAILYPKKNGKKAFKFPWFILGFVLASALVTFIPAAQTYGLQAAHVSRRLLVLTLFLVGANLNAKTLKEVGVRPLLQGIILWILVGTATLLFIHQGWIHV